MKMNSVFTRLFSAFTIVIILGGCTAKKIAKLPLCNSKKGVLLKYSKGSAYIILQKDSAFYEYRVFDKPSYFTGSDTLYFDTNCNCYTGKTLNLEINGSSNYYVRYLNNKYSDKLYKYVIAGKRELMKWNSYKNLDKYNTYAKEVHDSLNAFRSRPEQFHSLYNDYEKLLYQVGRLCKDDFDSVLNTFKKKYSIK